MINAFGKATRRDLLLSAGSLAVAVAAPTSRAQARPTSISGVVFEDRSGAGLRQPGDPGLPNVMVSNGRDVTVTDASGHYTLPAPDEAIFFVIKPAVYSTEIDPATQLPRFYRIHQPNGMPASMHTACPGVAPTGPLPASIDFALRRRDEPSKFEVELFADPQPASNAEVDFIREDVIDALAGTNRLLKNAATSS
jgi:hypothetical protein